MESLPTTLKVILVIAAAGGVALWAGLALSHFRDGVQRREDRLYELMSGFAALLVAMMCTLLVWLAVMAVQGKL